jgi:hypothetical protein
LKDDFPVHDWFVCINIKKNLYKQMIHSKIQTSTKATGGKDLTTLTVAKSGCDTKV